MSAGSTSATVYLSNVLLQNHLPANKTLLGVSNLMSSYYVPVTGPMNCARDLMQHMACNQPCLTALSLLRIKYGRVENACISRM